jgi:cell division protein FtsL
VYKKINTWIFSLLVFITFVLFFPCIVSADEPVKTPRVTKVTGKCELFETITVTVDNLPEFLAQTAQTGNDLSMIILYLDGYPLSAIHPRRDSASGNELIFDLIMVEDVENAQTQKSWNSLLGKPKLFPPTPRKVSVTVGIENRPPIDTDVRGANAYDLVTIEKLGLWIYLGILVAAVVLFVWLVIKSDILRDAGPQPEGKDDKDRPNRKTFSLSRTQMAFWFFLVIASYVFIWMVTDVFSILTPSVLTLIGISTATALGTTIMDANKRNSAFKKLESLNTEKDKLDNEIKSLNLKIQKPPAPEKLDALKEKLTDKNVELERLVKKIEDLKKTVKPLASEGFFEDILSDANGISFPRFQIAGWTLVLGVIFIASVYRVLSMPDFDTQLLALMGISSGTYIGFKFPEKME